MTDAVSAAGPGAATAAQQGGGQAASGAGAGFDLVLALMAQLGGMPGEPGAETPGEDAAPAASEVVADPLLGAPTDAAAAVMAALLVPQATPQTPVIVEGQAAAPALPTAAPAVAADAEGGEQAPQQAFAPAMADAAATETPATPAPKAEASTVAQPEAAPSEAAAPAVAAPTAKTEAKPALETAPKPSTAAPAAPARTAQRAEPAAQTEMAEEAPTGEQAPAVAVTATATREEAAPAQVKASVQATKTPAAEKPAPAIAQPAAAPVDATEVQAPVEAAPTTTVEEAASAAPTLTTATVAQQATVAAPAPRVAAPAQPAGESLRGRRLDNEGSELAQAPAGPTTVAAKSAVAGKDSPVTAEKKPFAIEADKPSSVAAQVEAAMTAAPETAEPTVETANGAAPSSSTSATGETARTDAAAQVRGSPETVAQLSAQIAKKLENKVTRFDIALDPVDLGRVNVKLEIGRDGRVSAAMSFEKPQAAAELKARSGELRDALQQAGFELAQDALTFDLADQGAHSNTWARQQAFGDDRQPAWNGRAFQAAMSGEDEPPLSNPALDWRASRASGVDVRI